MPSLVQAPSDPYMTAVQNIMGSSANANASAVAEGANRNAAQFAKTAQAQPFRPFDIGTTKVTPGSYGASPGYNSSHFGNGDYNSSVVGRILGEAKKYIGTAYKWGGKTPASGFDCSGLVSWAYGKAGIDVGQGSRNQYARSTKISAAQARSGDLVFYKTSGGTVHHVGIYMGNGKFLASPKTGDVVKIQNVYGTPYFGRVLK